MQGENFVTISPRIPWLKVIGLLCLRGGSTENGYKAGVLEVLFSYNNKSGLLAKDFHTDRYKGDGFLLMLVGAVQST